MVEGAGPSSAATDQDATGSTVENSDKPDTAGLNSLFARASGDKLNATPTPPAAIADPVAKPIDKPAQKPITVADARATMIPGDPSAPAAEKIAEPRGRAYLFRGVAGLIYSTGMDRLAERIKRAGVTASVGTYLMWRPVADQAIRDYRRVRPIIIIGLRWAAITPWPSPRCSTHKNIP